MKSSTLTITEHQAFAESECDSKKFFDALLAFSQIEGNERFIKHHKKSGIDYLKAQNYVGVIQTKYGTLEILPKCFDAPSLTQESNKDSCLTKHQYKESLENFFKIETFENQIFAEEQGGKNHFPIYQDSLTSSKNFLIFCLKTLKKTHFKHTKTSSLDTAHTPLLEIFMQMFCNELLLLVSKGIWHDYVTKEENRNFLKGKLLFSQHLHHNLTHKERFFTKSDEHIADIAPNRLIKSTLLLLKSLATSHTTRKLINRLLEVFEEITQSANIKADFLSCKASKHFAYYEDVLVWCRLFLEGKSFTAFSGESKAYALLFPMEKLFESYVAYMLSKANFTEKIKAQKSDKSLLQNKNETLFELRVDLHLTLQKNGKEYIVVADTKWKNLQKTQDKKHNISQSDLYQLLAYAKYHQAQEVWLIYPKPYSLQSKQDEEMISLIAEWNKREYCYLYSYENITLKILFAPLFFT